MPDFDVVNVKHGGEKVRQSFLEQWWIRKKAGDIILVALHFDAPGLPSYAIAIKSAHFTMVIFLAAAFTISGMLILCGYFNMFVLLGYLM